MSTLQASFLYTVNDINGSIRRTNTLLRGVNALRLTVRDINQLFESPSIPKFFWTMIQLTRTYNSLRRIYLLTMQEINKGTTLTNIVSKIPIVVPKKVPPPPTGGGDIFSDLTVRVDAFLDNRPITLDKLDLTHIPDDTRILLQEIMEDEAEIIVDDMRYLLQERILHPEASTGFLEASIGWMPEVFGTRIFANAYYSAWVEEGHRLPGGGVFTGHHYMRDGFERTKLRLPEKIKAELNGLILGDI